MEGLLLLSGEDGIESVDWKENNTSRPAWNRKWKRLRDLWDSSTVWNICDHQSPKRKERSEAEGTLEEIIAENFLKLMTDTKPQKQAAQKHHAG